MSTDAKSKTETTRSGIFTVKDEIARVDAKRSHVVIVGSVQARLHFRREIEMGKKLPTMQNFASVLALDSILQSETYHHHTMTLRDYSTLVADPTKQRLAKQSNRSLMIIFSSLELPDAPTLYDHLVLSLAPKRCNSHIQLDTFLCQACVRNRHFADAPHILFLHGNAAVGYCSNTEKRPAS